MKKQQENKIIEKIVSKKADSFTNSYTVVKRIKEQIK
jgi:hypothetical protein